MSGYIAFYFGVPITALFYFLIVLISYLTILAYIIIEELRKKKYIFLKLRIFNLKIVYLYIMAFKHLQKLTIFNRLNTKIVFYFLSF
ncbi:MAG: hypothetical protein ACFFAO_12265, partial [Candidatus Hermodarchaeota archaeon]